MTPHADIFRAEQDALDAIRQDPFAGDEPTEDYLREEAHRWHVEHCATAHGGWDCTCPVTLSSEAPF